MATLKERTVIRMDRKIKFSDKLSQKTARQAIRAGGEKIKEKGSALFESASGDGALSGIKDGVKTAARPIATFLFALMCANASPALGCLPFGIAAVCSAPDLPCAVAAFIGVLAGAMRMTSLGFVYSGVCAGVFFIRLFIGTVGIVKTGRTVKRISERSLGRVRDSPVRESTYYRLDRAFSSGAGANAVVALGGALALGVFGIITGGNLWYDVFSACLGLVLIPIFTLAYSSIGQEGISPMLGKAGIGAVMYAAVLALSQFEIGGMNVAVILSLIFTLWSAWSMGISDGVLSGFFVGIALDPSFSAMYAIAGAVSGALCGFSLGVGCSCAAVLAASWALYADGISAISEVLPEIILATALFYPAAYFRVLPADVPFLRVGNKKRAEDSPKGVSGNVGDRLRRISDAMSHMAGVFAGLSKRLRVPGNSETLAVCEENFAMACTTCEKREICHHREDFKNGSAVRKVASSLKENGRVNISSFPDTMARGCPRLDDVTDGINAEYAKIFENAAKSDKTAVAAGDYAMMAKMIRETLTEADAENSKNEELTEKLSMEFLRNKIRYESMSVYGSLRPRIFVRGFDVRDLTYGAKDIREMSEKVLGIGLSDPEMSIDYDKLNMFMECRKRFAMKHGQYSERAHRLEANGDVAVSFKGDDESFYMLVCDGMGSGREAALTSRVSAVFLERMIGAGCPVEVALMLLNDFTRERRIECSSSVDLLKIDPFCASASFIKSGAAPSFVLRDNKLFRIDSDTPPVGILKKPVAKETRFSLKDGDYVIMLSDGAMPENEGEAWLYDALTSASFIGNDLCASAERAVKEAVKRRSHADDCTVGIVSVSSL